MEEKCKTVAEALNRRLLYHAITLMKPLVFMPEADNNWSDRLLSLQQNYDYLTQYFSAGQNDPERDIILNQMIAEAYRLLDEINAQREKEHLILARVRMEDPRTRQNEFENAENPINIRKQVFHTFWQNSDWREVRNEWLTLLKEGDEEKLSMAVAGIILSNLDYFSERKQRALLRDISILPQKAQLRAIVGMLLWTQVYGERYAFYPEIQKAFQEVAEKEAYARYFLLANMYVVETSLVGEISKVMHSMQADILPDIEKHDPKTPIFLNLDEIDEAHPDWSAAMNKHIDAMSRLHQEGADFTYSSSQQMFRERFFQDNIANWFLSFDIQHPQLTIDLSTEGGQLVRKLVNLNIEACDSDKYATCLMYRHIKDRIADAVPQVVHEMGNTNMHEMLSGEEKVYYLLRSEVRNWYRFFLHNPWGYANLLEHADTLSRSAMPKVLHWGDKEISKLADRCLQLGLYEATEELFLQVQEESAEKYQKIGFALQKRSKFDEAFLYFQQAIRLQGEENDVWTIRQAAYCLRKKGDTQRALRYYERLLELEPNKKSYLLAKAKCLLEAEALPQAKRANQEKALQVYFQLDLLYPNELAIQRGLAWCTFLCDRQETAERYAEQLASAETANANDCLNYAHILLCQKRRQEAIYMYETAQKKAASLQFFFHLFRKDKAILRQKGIAAEDLALLEDIFVRNRRKG